MFIGGDSTAFEGRSTGGGVATSRVSNWTFKTRYPRPPKVAAKGKKKPKSVIKKSSAFGSKRENTSLKIRGLALPSTLRLAKTLSRPEQKPAAPEQATRKSQSSSTVKTTPNGAGRRNSSSRRSGPESARRSMEAAARRLELARKRAAWDARFAMDNVDVRRTSTAFSDVSPQTTAQLEHRIKTTTFTSMGLRPEVMAAISETLGPGCKPTPVQALAIPASLNPQRNGKPLLIGAETGSGKTLAYIIPMIQRLREEESLELQQAQQSLTTDDVIEAVVSSHAIASMIDPQTNKVRRRNGMEIDGAGIGNDSHMMSLVASSKIRRLRRPRGIIFVPTRDLVDQVTGVIRSLCSHTAKLTVLGLHHSSKHYRSAMERLASTPIDIVVTTPAALEAQFNAKGAERLYPSHISEIVIDEADTIMDQSFHAELEACMRSIETATSSKPPLTTFVSATFPVAMVKGVTARYPSHIRITTPKLHRTPTQLKQSFVRVSGSDTKISLITDLLRMSINGGDSRVLIFCNRRETVEWLGEYLRSRYARATESDGKTSNDVGGFFTNSVGIITAGTDMREREAAIELFSGPRVRSRRNTDGDISRSDSSEFRVLVATDVASRGLDLTAVDHVVNYDFPMTAMEYLHRVGRTARNGGNGRATSFVEKKSTALATMIETAVRKRAVLA